MLHAAARRQALSVRAQTPGSAPAPTAQCPVAASKKASLFVKLGGRAGVEAAVDRFYNKVISDPTVSPYFSATDMQKQRSKQTAFLAYALGGAAEWKGKDMRTAHKHLMPKLDATHFQAIAVHLQATLTELGADPQDIQDAMAVVASTKTEVLDQ